MSLSVLSTAIDLREAYRECSKSLNRVLLLKIGYNDERELGPTLQKIDEKFSIFAKTLFVRMKNPPCLQDFIVRHFSDYAIEYRKELIDFCQLELDLLFSRTIDVYRIYFKHFPDTHKAKERQVKSIARFTPCEPVERRAVGQEVIRFCLAPFSKSFSDTGEKERGKFYEDYRNHHCDLSKNKQIKNPPTFYAIFTASLNQYKWKVKQMSDIGIIFQRSVEAKILLNKWHKQCKKQRHYESVVVVGLLVMRSKRKLERMLAAGAEKKRKKEDVEAK